MFGKFCKVILKTSKLWGIPFNIKDFFSH